ncbi:hypothetical protein YTPLAS73_00380 [Nitrosarchaeum sp.]|nr:hypothetical protein YTPLAS73_00380 [Nitrosarchaeum sp.]
MVHFSHDFNSYVFIQNQLVTGLDENALKSKTFEDIFEKNIKQFIVNHESFLPLMFKIFQMDIENTIITLNNYFV